MEARASAKFVRSGPRKVRMILDMIRGLPVRVAEPLLKNHARRAAAIVYKVLKSAAANALDRDSKVDPDELVVKSAWVDAGPILHRFRPMSMGRGGRIRKRTSRITVVLSDTK